MENSLCRNCAILFFALCCLSSCQKSTSVPLANGASKINKAQSTIMATAHISHAKHLLGRPFDENFQPLSGPQGLSIFENQAKIIRVKRDEWQHRAIVFNSSQCLKANLYGWGILQANSSFEVSNRYATRRIYHLTEYEEIEDTAEIRQLTQDAKYYLWRIYYGHLYENYLVGSMKNFHVGVSAKFLKFGADVQTFADQNELEAFEVGRGLTPFDRKQAFVAIGSNMEQRFKASESPQPILVEYRSISTTNQPDEKLIGFSEEAPWEDGNYIISIKAAKISNATPAGSTRAIVPNVAIMLSLDRCKSWPRSSFCESPLLSAPPALVFASIARGTWRRPP